jgi:nicotinamide-nucleotide amidase
MAGSVDAVGHERASLRTAGIIAVGTELLTPDRIDTNSLHLTAQLNSIGIDVVFKSVAGDDEAQLSDEIAHALARCDVLVTSGGLGPTSDDVTRDAVARALGLPLEEDPDLLARIRERFERRGLAMPEINRRQAAVVRGARVLPNPNGTAPGQWIETGSRVVVLLPGPPRELEPMFDQHVKPALANRSGGRMVRRRVIRVAGLPESRVEELAHPAYAPLASGRVPVATTILASPGIIELHLSVRGDAHDELDRALQAGVEAVARAVGPAVFSIDGRTLEQVVGDRLLERGWFVATAESCTGGLVAARLTSVPGSSGWFRGGTVAYDNRVKLSALDVAPNLLSEHGAVSEPVAEAMADGVRRRLAADVGVAITGIAGPTGGSPEKPIGTVVIAVSVAESTVARTHRLPGDRQLVRQHSVVLALDAVRRAVQPDPTK